METLKQEEKEVLNDIEKETKEEIIKEEIIKEESIKPEAQKPTEDSKKDEIETKNYAEVNEEVRVKKSKKGIIIATIVSIIILLVIIFSTIFAIINRNNDKIFTNINIDGISVAGLTEDEARAKLSEEVANRLTRKINIQNGENKKTITLEEIEIEYDIDTAINEAYSLGRSGNIIKDNYDILFSNFNTTSIQLNVKYNENNEKIDYLISDLQNELPGKVIEFDYEIDEDELIVTPGKKGLKIKEDVLKKAILDKVKNYDTQTILVETEQVEPQKINAQELRNKIYKEPKDATYEKTPKFVIHPHVVGIDFKSSIEEVQKILDEEKEEYVIKLKLTKPAVLTNDIGDEIFPDLLGRQTTSYDASNTARSSNLRLASNKINGTIVLPGETFSYNKVVGKRTVEAGYKDAKIYENGKVVDGLGGGICQVSSTLYNAVLYANLEIVSRRNHQFKTSYIEAGRDATVVYGSTDFQFKNTRNYPIKIKCSASGGVCTFEIYGMKEEVEYDVSISTETISTIPFTTIYEDTTALAAGTTKVMQGGMNGYKTKTYRTLKQNGVKVKTELLSSDTYNPMNKIIQRGVAAEVTEPTPPTVDPVTPVEPTVPEPPVVTPTEPTVPETPTVTPEPETPTVVPEPLPTTNTES